MIINESDALCSVAKNAAPCAFSEGTGAEDVSGTADTQGKTAAAREGSWDYELVARAALAIIEKYREGFEELAK